MEIPIYIDGKRTGAAVITAREGAVDIVASLDDPGRVVRLTLYGEGEVYLGVPEPRDGRLYLTKRISGAALRDFPKNPAYAAEKRTDPPKPKTHRIWHGGKPYYF